MSQKKKSVPLSEFEADLAERRGMDPDEFRAERDAAAARAGMSPARYSALRGVRSLSDYQAVVKAHGTGRGY